MELLSQAVKLSDPAGKNWQADSAFNGKAAKTDI